MLSAHHRDLAGHLPLLLAIGHVLHRCFNFLDEGVKYLINFLLCFRIAFCVVVPEKVQAISNSSLKFRIGLGLDIAEQGL